MTIVFLCRLFYPHIGGVEKHVREVGKRLADRGHKLIVITESSLQVYPNGQKPVFFEKIDGMDVYRIPVGENEKGKKWVIWKWIWEHRDLLKDVDAIHAHDVFFWILPLKLLFYVKNVYVTFHGYETYPIRWQAIWMRKISEKLSAGNICIGDFMKKWYGTKPTFISYGGVTIPKKEQTWEKKDSAVFWGRLDEHTGILTYQKAHEIISKKYAQFAFTVIGNGELDNKIDHSRLKLINFQENITPFLSKAHFAFVSRYLSILEALAYKRLVFTVYDNPVKQDYLEMASFAPYVIIEKTPEKLAEKVIYFLEHPQEEKRLIEQGYEWIKTQTWDAVVETYEKLWDIQ